MLANIRSNAMGGMDFDMFVMLPGNMVLDSQALLQAVEVCKLFKYTGCILFSSERRHNYSSQRQL